MPLIQEWAKKREVYKKVASFNQLLRTHEDAGGLIRTCYDDDRPAIRGVVGDVIVALINYCYMERIDILEQINDVLSFERK